MSSSMGKGQLALEYVERNTFLRAVAILSGKPANGAGVYIERKTGEISQAEKVSEQGPAARREGSAPLAEAKHGKAAISADGREGHVKGPGSGLASLGDMPSLGKKMVSSKGWRVSSPSRAACI